MYILLLLYKVRRCTAQTLQSTAVAFRRRSGNWQFFLFSRENLTTCQQYSVCKSAAFLAGTMIIIIIIIIIIIMCTRGWCYIIYTYLVTFTVNRPYRDQKNRAQRRFVIMMILCSTPVRRYCVYIIIRR